MSKNINPHIALHQTTSSILKHDVDHLQVIPLLAIKLLRLNRDNTNRAAELSTLISSEPALAEKVLSNVNSVVLLHYQKIKSIKQAILILGDSGVRQIALNQLIYNKLIYHKANFDFDQLFFWHHCLFVATLARTIATSLNYKDPDLMYSAGLLHDIGKIILETHAKNNYSDFIRHGRDGLDLSLQSEQSFFGLNHAEIGFVFCQQWKIPKPITAGVYCHHTMPDDHSHFADCKLEIAIISLANYIASVQGIGSTTAKYSPLLHPEVLNQFDIETIDIKELLNIVDNEMQNTCAMFGIKSPNLYKIRASLVETAIHCSWHVQHTNSLPGNISVKSLTIPHKSLDPDEIIPATLAAIQQYFHFERLIMLNINPKQRNLETTYNWPASLKDSSLQHFNIPMDVLPNTLLGNLRERKAVIINSNHPENKILLEPFKVDEFLLLPIVSNDRLVALLYADNHLSCRLMDPQCITYIAPIIHELGIALANAQSFILERNRAELDSLTGLSNSRKLSEFLSNLFRQDISQLSQIAVGFIDIDFFKQFNDSCGHQVGDEALVMVAQIMRSLTRPGDFIGRYGGDEFVFVLQSTDKKGVYSYAERIRLEVEQQGKTLSRQFLGHEITISVGISLFHQEFNSYEKIISAADTAMYQAKQQWRNCVVIV
ncbi:two-component system, cell cycle response regulator [Bathymodiolus japonicus methanotrophic gill symbiont]|uniref:diguanylate cyclase domain-containing protein n=1 Tax=Bathymodiolus japonicus methanotrophic gill symbiont TaxID=113269 RepID=UPI001B4AB3A1|nr:diguanylate cyclase [Bathymodiolus japonicus methanotrophic gill symbiont]GFO71954.1 two-component system, cell cycle response regulator [Bathymodiolus japonicus methanotrophic gill symbiont]